MPGPVLDSCLDLSRNRACTCPGIVSGPVLELCLDLSWNHAWTCPRIMPGPVQELCLDRSWNHAHVTYMWVRVRVVRVSAFAGCVSSKALLVRAVVIMHCHLDQVMKNFFWQLTNNMTVTSRSAPLDPRADCSLCVRACIYYTYMCVCVCVYVHACVHIFYMQPEVIL